MNVATRRRKSLGRYPKPYARTAHTCAITETGYQCSLVAKREMTKVFRYIELHLRIHFVNNTLFWNYRFPVILRC